MILIRIMKRRNKGYRRKKNLERKGTMKLKIRVEKGNGVKVLEGKGELMEKKK